MKQCGQVGTGRGHRTPKDAQLKESEAGPWPSWRAELRYAGVLQTVAALPSLEKPGTDGALHGSVRNKRSSLPVK